VGQEHLGQASALGGEFLPYDRQLNHILMITQIGSLRLLAS
jgi:hypothetical protein